MEELENRSHSENQEDEFKKLCREFEEKHGYDPLTDFGKIVQKIEMQFDELIDGLQEAGLSIRNDLEKIDSPEKEIVHYLSMIDRLQEQIINIKNAIKRWQDNPSVDDPIVKDIRVANDMLKNAMDRLTRLTKKFKTKFKVPFEQVDGMLILGVAYSYMLEDLINIRKNIKNS